MHRSTPFSAQNEFPYPLREMSANETVTPSQPVTRPSLNSTSSPQLPTNSITLAVKAWYLLCLHTIFSVALWAFMTQVLPGKTFAIGRSGNFKSQTWSQLYQSDITTFISILIALSRLIAGLWQTLTVWRCIFLLLEMKSLTLSEIKVISSYNVPSWSASRAYSRSGFVWTIAIVLLFAFLSPFAGPIATGSVTWTPSQRYDETVMSTPFIGPAEPNNAWSWYLDFSNMREYMVQESAGLANLDSLLLPNNITGAIGITQAPPARRPTTRFRILKNGTRFEELTVPFFNITSFVWVNNDELDEDLKGAVLNDTGPLGVSNQDNPLQITLEGVAAPLKTTIWNGSSLAKDKLPEASVLRGSRYAALKIKRGQTTPGRCSDLQSSVFQTIPTILHSDAWNNITSCFAVAKMDIVAGTVQCVSNDSNNALCSLYRSSLAVEYHSDRPYIIQPDQLIEQVFAMLPEVMALMITTGGFTSTYDITRTMPPVEPEMFLRNFLTLGYQGTWSAFTERLASPVTSVNYREPVPIVISLVNQSRMDIWLGIQLLLTVSGMILCILHRKSTWPASVEPFLSLLLLDCSRIMGSDGKPTSGRLILSKGDEYAGGYGGGYGVLKPKTKGEDAEYGDRVPFL